MRGRLSRVFIPVLLLVSTGCQQREGLSRSKIRQLEKAVTQVMTRQQVPGISVAVAVNGELQYSNGYGLSDVENSVPARADTVYRLASVSKPITAVAALQLAEKGKLDLDTPVQEYVRGFPDKPWPITARQLLAHQGGIRHYRTLAEVNSTRHYRNLKESLTIFQNDPLVAEPGTAYSYTTYGYVLLGAVVEGASGIRFVGYIRERIFQPAGMDHTQPDDVYAIISKRARGYRIRNGKLENRELADTSYKIPGGGLVSTVGDMVRFALAIRNGVLLKPQTAEQMFTPQKLRNGRKTAYGLGWNVVQQDGTTVWVAHGGDQQGVAANLAMLPRHGIVVALLSNLEHANMPALSIQILNILLQ